MAGIEWTDWDEYKWDTLRRNFLKKTPRKIIVIPINWPANNELVKIKEKSKKKKIKTDYTTKKPPKPSPYGPPKKVKKTYPFKWDNYNPEEK